MEVMQGQLWLYKVFLKNACKETENEDRKLEEGASCSAVRNIIAHLVVKTKCQHMF